LCHARQDLEDSQAELRQRAAYQRWQQEQWSDSTGDTTAPTAEQLAAGAGGREVHGVPGEALGAVEDDSGCSPFWSGWIGRVRGDRPGPTGGVGTFTSPEAILSACAAVVARELSTPTGSRVMQATVQLGGLSDQAAMDEVRAAAVAIVAAAPRVGD
jgi:hypothetical protein